MQNINSTSYINKKKIINIKSEMLFREAEDDFFYFNKVNNAYKKLAEAVKLTPNHLKSLNLLADICFMKGMIKKALNLNLRAEKLCCDSRTFASIASCYYILGNYESALDYCEKALNNIEFEEGELFSQIIEIKINILVKKRAYKKAYITFIQAQNTIDKSALKMLYDMNYELLSEKIGLQKRRKRSNLKIV